MIIPITKRRKTQAIAIGGVQVGGSNPIAIQSMCDTKTEDVEATVAQILALEGVGCEIIRVAIPTKEAAQALPLIKEKIHIPLVADIHFRSDLALLALENGADKIRINPGNISDKNLLRQIIDSANKHNAAIRIGVNAGSLEQDLWDKYDAPTAEALAESALNWVKFFENENFNQLVLSVKSSQVPTMITANEILATQTNYPLHLGVTEAGPPPAGSIKSAIGIGSLLQKGIGETIRVSLTADPVEEVQAAKEILKSLKLYDKEPDIVSCPGCGRTEIDIQKLTQQVQEMVARLNLQKPYRIAVMGCVVNALGEAKEADFAIAGGQKQGNLYYQGELYKGNIPEKELLKEFEELILQKIR
ncbi:flavodoxin-dependent (E)-4-hydroxy-3-methylbut-2-enyl-diphosphate synthase [Candidatus Peregrinibacteria bacterium]|nr:flavodoxin-dependent (E)-4-hydroxy-3-methylbut-2-enyl-diphosphate synthase [Candidatus Peregrinibacteria bacterium]MBT7703355.1 flavodoxin-dependent (E)-4-hydroxy-3-methylbut-2-enyl-diphosphate synthase [Candidatus Peregrinibacteria bacterium]